MGEVCFNTAMTGYQEIMTDPSYAAQIVTFTFPHIGNVGANVEDMEAINPHAVGCIVREDVTGPSNFRSTGAFDAWLRTNGRIGLAGVDTRALTRMIREKGAPNAVIAHRRDGAFDVDELVQLARDFGGLEGMDLARGVSTLQTYKWDEGLWRLGVGYAQKPPLPLAGEGRGEGSVLSTNPPEVTAGMPSPRPSPESGRGRPSVVAIDYGLKRNILRSLIDAGADVTVVPATASFADIMAHSIPPGCSSATAPAIRPRRANMPCR